jgi:uncharacterized protein (DUF1800 family)
MYNADDIGAAARPLHTLNRLAFGPRPGDVERVQRMGVNRYIDQQLEPASISERAELSDRIAALKTIRMGPVELFSQFRQPIRDAAKGDTDAKQAARQQARQVIVEAAEARILRAIYSRRQLHEVMTAFWFNHFNVFVGKGLCSIWTGAFEEEAIRPHTLGRFRDLLGATAKHPAMLFYLDNWQNTAPNAPGTHGKFDGINENYARELMELHTLGVGGGYTQSDVIAVAHILTGWGLVKRGAGMGLHGTGGGGVRQESGMEVLSGNRQPRLGGFFPSGPLRRSWMRRMQLACGRHQGGGKARPGQTGVLGQYGFYFDAARHDFGGQHLLGREIAGGGIEQGEQALDLLARSPATANHLSYQLAQYFVADDPPEGLVSRMAARYLATDGNIREVLATLFASAEFHDPRCYGVKFKTPYEYVISAARATGANVVNIQPLAGTMAQMGMPLYGCQTPDGYKNTREAWLNPEAMMMRLSFATALGAGRLPLAQIPDDDFGALGSIRHPERVRPIDYSGEMPAPDAAQLALTLGDSFSPRTAEAGEAAPVQLRTPLILGSPEFMLR